MGQMTIGVLYGIEAPVGVTLRDDYALDDPSGPGLLDRWEVECSPRIKAHTDQTQAWMDAKPGRMPYERESGWSRYVPDQTYDVRPKLIGFWIAAGASGKNGLPSLGGAVTFAGVRTTEPYARAYRNARRRWARFARWARAQGVALPRPRLWITETEVA